jgi:hypothetical protein
LSANVVSVWDVNDGAELTVNVPPVEAPALSVTVKVYEPGTVADVDEKLAVVTSVTSAAPEKVTPGAVDETVTVPPLSAKSLEPVMVTVPEAPVPNQAAVPLCEPFPWLPDVVLKLTLAIVVAPAADPNANGNAAAINTAPAARAFTP